MVRIKRSGKFDRMLDNLYLANEDLREVIRQRIKLFENNPNDTRLDNHPLRKRLAGKWAFSITGNIRIVYEWLGGNSVRFLAIGPHPGVYSRKL